MTSEEKVWTKLTTAKTKMLELWRSGPVGAKVVAVKAIQRIVQTQTVGTADPRVSLADQSLREHLADVYFTPQRQATVEPNLAMVRANHSVLKTAQLEDEANKLLEECVTALFTSTVPDVIAAIAAAVTQLVKARPAIANLVVTALVHWSPAALGACSASQVKSVEKTVRIALTHLLK